MNRMIAAEVQTKERRHRLGCLGGQVHQDAHLRTVFVSREVDRHFFADRLAAERFFVDR